MIVPSKKFPEKDLSILGRAGLKIVNENTISPEIGRFPYSRQEESNSSLPKNHRLLSIIRNLEWLKKEISTFVKKLT